ncbi:preprotein translocase subunit SecG [Sedimentisphaera salicampi]|uniref:Protein-export membrane protein SecG n=1 Tax=Sedimentisphaera salicampi TaxID=1941349 RepID=A0A1W6LNT2_9BACT|nr:preprotein translocase subunit SecG [Sedimentisphaera salicampi]ARN57439.1 Preprotein translocase band 1 subunit [Sedimentisphaera salicampi]OXU14455.1 Preprotein translocase band 1 subunit [Sedimentisphaera salicampi]
MLLPFAKVPVIMSIIAVIWALSGLLLILIILIQKGKGGGLGSAFGGAGSTSLLGTKTGDFLTWVTIGLVSVFLIFSVVMAKYYRPTDLEQLKQEQPDIEAVDESMLIDEEAEESGQTETGENAEQTGQELQSELESTADDVQQSAEQSAGEAEEQLKSISGEAAEEAAEQQDNTE